MPPLEIRELFWAAGFLEGEGSFGACSGPSRQHGQIRITCHQVQREPLDRLHRLFGGNVMGPHRGPKNPIFLWSLQYRKAVSLMMTLYAVMSENRKKQIRAALSYWKSFRAHRSTWLTCQKGHELIFDQKSNKRRCRTCHADRARARRNAT